MANSNLGTVAILRGNGDGTFAAAVTVAVVASPTAVVVGDFNGDGKLDLAVANGTALILLGNGDGTFVPPVSYAAGDTAFSITVSDFSGDGKADLAVTNYLSSDVSILTGNGDGSFGAAVNYSAGFHPILAAAGDFNGDGKSDLVVANFDRDHVSISATVSGGGDVSPANNTVSDLTAVTAASSNLTISKSHSGNFAQGQTGAAYSIVVSNIGSITTSGMVTVVDTLPAGLSATAMTGTGWSCNAGTLTCTRSDGLAAGAAYPTIALTADVASNAPLSITNSATVSGGGDVSPANNTVSDLTAVTAASADLTITKTHVGTFSAGQTNAAFTMNVSNVGLTASAGTVTVTDTLPAGLTATAVAGPGWTCTLATLTCTRSDALAGASSYPPITLTVSVSSVPPSSVTNTATVGGGGDTNPSNDTAGDLVTISPNQQIPTLSRELLLLLAAMVVSIALKTIRN